MKINKLIFSTIIVGILGVTIPITNTYSQTDETINKEIRVFEDIEVAKVDSNNKITLEQGCTATEIQDAIDKMSSLGGGAVILSKGTYILDNSIRLKSNVILQGTGKEQTILKREENYRINDGKGLIYSNGGLENVMNSEDKGVCDFVIKNNEVYGNGGYGISISGICKNGYLVNNIDGGNNNLGYLLNRGKNIVEINR